MSPLLVALIVYVAMLLGVAGAVAIIEATRRIRKVRDDFRR
jgi:hypothetical protein